MNRTKMNRGYYFHCSKKKTGSSKGITLKIWFNKFVFQNQLFPIFPKREELHKTQLSMVEHNCNISILEAEAGGLQYPGHLGLRSVDFILEIHTILIIPRQNGSTSSHLCC